MYLEVHTVRKVQYLHKSTNRAYTVTICTYCDKSAVFTHAPFLEMTLFSMSLISSNDAVLVPALPG
jgi:hypothetical protein